MTDSISTRERTGLIRLLDAAANRAREGLRTLEDLARFVLDDAEVTGELKSIRHGLAGAIEAMGVGDRERLAARDTPGDVGTGVSTDREMTRASAASIAAAAGARTCEALRSIEEVAKVLAPGAGGVVEALRYRVYDAERRVRLALDGVRAKTAPQWRVCVLLTESICAQPWRDVAEAAIAGGADCLQLREKDMDAGELVRRARALVAIARGRCAVIVNDRPDVACAAGADGVHLGQTDLPAADAVAMFGHQLVVGMSSSTVEMAAAAVAAGASYVGLGPIFSSTTKAKPTLAGVELVRGVLADERTSGVPHLAISGIDATGAAELAKAGCRGVAVSSAVCAAGDPEAATRAICEAIEEARSPADC